MSTSVVGAVAASLPHAASGHEVLAVPLRQSAYCPAAVWSKARSCRIRAGALLAAATRGGGHAAVAGVPRLGLLAAVEMGGAAVRAAAVADPVERRRCSSVCGWSL